MAGKTRTESVATKDGFGVGPCSACEELRVTLGQQKHGGIRYCVECIRHTLAWAQLGEEQRLQLLSRFATIGALPATQKALAVAATIGPDGRKAIAIGESTRRFCGSMREDRD